VTTAARTGPARRELRHQVARQVLRQVLLPGLFVYVLLVGAGLLLANPLAGAVAGEDELNRDLAEGRTPDWNAVTAFLGMLSNTPAVMATLFVLVVVLRLGYGRWREAATLVTAVLLQATVFLLTTLVVDRPRPDVPKLDGAPPTSSFPSGHTGAATALYLTLALVIGWRMRRPLLRLLVVLLLVSIPVGIAVARLYRGMHHPTDVAFGMLNGLACLVIAARAFLLDPSDPYPRRPD